MNEKLPKYVEPVINRVGTKYHYFRYKGKRLGALPGAPYSTEFMKAYYDFLAAVEGKAPLPTAKPKKVKPEPKAVECQTTFGEVIRTYRQSREYAALKDGSRAAQGGRGGHRGIFRGRGCCRGVD